MNIKNRISNSGLYLFLAMTLMIVSCESSLQPHDSVDELDSITSSESVVPSLVTTNAPFEGLCNGDANSEITCDPNTGLQYLDLPGTFGLTYPQMLDKLANDPAYSQYRYATNSEVVQLFANAGINPPNDPFFRSENVAAVSSLQGLVGVTQVEDTGSIAFGQMTLAAGFTGDPSGGTSRSIGVLQISSTRGGMSYLSNMSPNATNYGHWLILENQPQTKDDCKKSGWEAYGFKNQGQCIRFVNTGKDSR